MPDYSPYFDQEGPQMPITGLVACHDDSQPYELDAAAVFAGVQEGTYLVVIVSGCSCWPDRGSTTQTHCSDKSAVDRALSTDTHSHGWRDLLQKCQDAGWKATR